MFSFWGCLLLTFCLISFVRAQKLLRKRLSNWVDDVSVSLIEKVRDERRKKAVTQSIISSPADLPSQLPSSSPSRLFEDNLMKISSLLASERNLIYRKLHSTNVPFASLGIQRESSKLYILYFVIFSAAHTWCSLPSYLSFSRLFSLDKRKSRTTRQSEMAIKSPLFSTQP